MTEATNQHLTDSARCHIFDLHSMGCPADEIAGILHLDRQEVRTEILGIGVVNDRDKEPEPPPKPKKRRRGRKAKPRTKGKYKLVSKEERHTIYHLRKRGLSKRQIAKQLGRSPSTITREINRNSGKKGYRHKQAQNKAVERRKAASSGPRKMTPENVELIEYLLRTLQWSPKQISGRLRLLGIMDIGYTSIYEHVYADRRKGGDLYKCLRRRGKRRNRRGRNDAGRGHLKNVVSIKEREKEANEKLRIGDWEVDTVVGLNHNRYIVTVVDRKSKYMVMQLVDHKTADEVSKALVGMLEATGGPVHTITSDNGKEFADHEKVSKALAAKFYFAEPYHSWERGLNEHTNGLVRWYLPKGTDFRTITDEQLKGIQDLLNGRPREVLGYRTPQEVFHGQVQMALAA